MFRHALLIAALSVTSLLGIVNDEEDLARPGSIRFQGLTEADEVRVDGELVNAAGLARSGYVLLLAPGEYLITVKKADSGKIQAARIRIGEGVAVHPESLREPVKMARAE